MDGTLLRDAFAHHVWATLRVIDACAGLPPARLEGDVPGTYGSILATLRHLVAADAGYLGALSPGRVPTVDEDAGDLDAIRGAMDLHDAAWAELLGRDLDPGAIVVRHRADGSESHAPLTIRLAQALHHGTDHRSQICTALTLLGVEPPAIDLWDFAKKDGRLVDVPPSP